MPQLRGILEGCPESRLVLTTRNRLIGSSVGLHVDFDARDPLGPTSTSMFMGYATNGRPTNAGGGEQLASVEGILRLCAGLPIALAVTGIFVVARLSLGYTFATVCDRYYKELEQKTNLGATILEGAIKLSLDYLDSTVMTVPDVSAAYSMYKMYTSFCVLENQQWISVSVLAKMWGIEDMSAESIAQMFSSLSLAKISVHHNSVGVSIHDLHRDFCCQQGEDDVKKWHFRLLFGHMPSLSASTCELVDFGSDLRRCSGIKKTCPTGTT